MAARYWRLVGVETYGLGANFEVSELALYEGATRVDASATLTSSHTPVSGTLNSYSDVDNGTSVAFSYDQTKLPAFNITWDFGAGVTKEITELRVRAAASSAKFPFKLTLEYSADSVTWMKTDVNGDFLSPKRIPYPGDYAEQSFKYQDTYLSLVSLQLRGDGANNGTVFTDDSLYLNPITAAGSVVTSSTQSKFGGTSIYFPGLSSVLSTPGTSEFDFADRAFTLEFWMYSTGAASQYLLNLNSGGVTSSAFSIEKAANGSTAAYLYSSSTVYSVQFGTVSNNTWHHIALCRSGTTVTAFLNGTITGTTTVPGALNYNNSVPLRIGNYQDGSLPFVGYMDDIVVTNGYARYSTNFTPRATGYPAAPTWLAADRVNAPARYWSLHSLAAQGLTSDVEFSEVEWYSGTTRIDTGVPITSTLPPKYGTLSALNDSSLSGYVGFAVEDYARPGFALAWDFGSEVSIDTIKIGGASSATSHVNTFLIQESADGETWEGVRFFSGVYYPGANTTGSDLQIKSVTLADPFEASVKLRLRFDGASMVDTSPLAHVVTAVNGALTSSNVKYGSHAFSATARGAIFSPTQFALSGNFTLEFWMFLPASSTCYPVCVVRNSGVSAGWYITVTATLFGLGCYTGPAGVSVPCSPPLASWAHYAITRSGTTLTFYINGVSVGTATGNGTYAITNVIDGTLGGPSEFGGSACVVDDVRITTALRYTAAFNPPDQTFLSPSAYAVFPTARGGLFESEVSTINKQAINEFSATATNGIGSVVDTEDGGLYRVSGTVKEKAAPTNIPLKRKVRLHLQVSGRFIRETWSDPVTGEYSFDYIRGDQQYYVVSFDHTGAYRGVIADYQNPTLM